MAVRGCGYDVLVTTFYRFVDGFRLCGMAHLAPWEIAAPMPDIRHSLDAPSLPIRLLGRFVDPEDDSRHVIVRYRDSKRYLLTEQEWDQLVPFDLPASVR
jgi:hypothetical protein